MDKAHEPRAALSKAFRKVKPNRADFETFKAQLGDLLGGVKAGESEEFHKNLIADFLKKSYYAAHAVNTKERNDLVIHEGKTAATPVAVILETKKPDNKSQTPTAADLNRKALHELALYYLRERVTNKNLNVKHLIVANTYEWFIFDANVFEKAFIENKAFLKQYEDFAAGRLASSKTEFFYTSVAKPFIAQLGEPFPFTYVDLRDYGPGTDEKKLITLYKLFSPEHLLKLPFANDSNTLDKTFYAELLHIIGLTETKAGGKKLIVRQEQTKRGDASLLENTIIQLADRDKISRLDDPQNYGSTLEGRLFNVALELSITWVNRILFLKLLESQLKSYHNDADMGFLNAKRLHNYDDLNTLFFGVLARPVDERSASVKDFERVPYLNSSLFELSELEHLTLDLSALRDERELPLYAGTVLKDANGKRRTGSLGTLTYLFEFLDAYDFSSEGTETVQEERKTLINASVLGLIFEKINGYKDGSFFTPGFITMYMCRETVRRAVVQKFNEVKGWRCGTFDELYNQLGNTLDDKREANRVINSVKVCDPAVGSGHFLVSALNELLSIKSELKVLLDENGKTLRDYALEVSNDELVISDSDGELFAYNPKNAESQRVQKTLFLEKQTLIENCLFGVDVNPNSIKICRLRLWIELLKHAYYKADGQLETLPNIDINIKTGNSLISRFALDADLKQALKKSDHTKESYQNAVSTYRNASSKEEKREMERLIKSIKTSFRVEMLANDPKIIEQKRLRAKLGVNQDNVFADVEAQTKEQEKEKAKIQKRLEVLEKDIQEVKDNRIFEGAFEWRFEFPEVLDDNGDFIGFDVVIGNPPYIDSEEMVRSQAALRDQLTHIYDTAVGNWDLFVVFVECGAKILRNRGVISYIVPNKLVSVKYTEALRKYMARFSIIELRDYSKVRVFAEADVYPVVFLMQRSPPISPVTMTVMEHISTIHTQSVIDQDLFKRDIFWDRYFSSNPASLHIIEKLLLFPLLEQLGEVVGAATVGEAYETKKELEDGTYNPLEHKKFINTGTIDRYASLWGLKDTRYIKDGYLYPLISNVELGKISKTRLRQAETEKIVIGGMTKVLECFYDTGEYLAGKSTTIFLSGKINLKFTLGLLNSRLVNFFYSIFFNSLSLAGGYLRLGPPQLKKIPIRTINFSDPADKQKHDAVVGLVETMLSLHEQKALADPSERARLEGEIAAADAQIDRLVYGLYGLSEEEIRIVEEAVKA